MKTEKEQLDEALAELKAFKYSIAFIEELHLTPGAMVSHIRQNPALRECVAQCFAAILGDAPNYVELSFNTRAGDKLITVTIGKHAGKTPHQKRAEAEAVLCECYELLCSKSFSNSHEEYLSRTALCAKINDVLKP